MRRSSPTRNVSTVSTPHMAWILTSSASRVTWVDGPTPERLDGSPLALLNTALLVGHDVSVAGSRRHMSSRAPGTVTETELRRIYESVEALVRKVIAATTSQCSRTSLHCGVGVWVFSDVGKLSGVGVSLDTLSRVSTSNARF